MLIIEVKIERRGWWTSPVLSGIWKRATVGWN